MEKRYNLEISLDDVIAVYDLHDAEAEEVYNQIVQGEYDIEQFIEDAADNDIYFDWDWMDEDDWWTDRKGGYDVTYEVIEHEPTDPDLLKRLEELKAEFDKLIADEQKDEK